MRLMTNTAVQPWTITVDDNPPVLVLEMRTTGPEIDYVRSESAVMPDPHWSATDEHGHQHKWTRTDRKANRTRDALPTLTPSQEHVECDGSCGGVCAGEGYDVTVWHCTICGDRVEPGYIPDYEARTTGIPISVGPGQITIVAADDPPVDADFDTHTRARRVLLQRTNGDVTERLAGQGWIGDIERSSEGTRYEVTFVPDR